MPNNSERLIYRLLIQKSEDRELERGFHKKRCPRVIINKEIVIIII